MKTIAFFSNEGGVGTTSLVYHLAWMYCELGLSVVAADLDSQANLTSMFLEDYRIEQLWPDGPHPKTIYGAIQPLLGGAGDIAPPHVEGIADGLGILVGDLALSSSEDELSGQWLAALDGKQRAFRVLSAFWRLIENAAEKRGADLALIDIGPNLGAINRTALIAAKHVVIPLASDLYSLQGLKNLGPTLRSWRQGWQERRDRIPTTEVSIPAGTMEPLGYIVMQHAVRLDRPVKAYDRWMARIPAVYRESVLATDYPLGAPQKVSDDPYCLAGLKHYPSLMSLAQEAHKPMFFLTAADGAIGGHARAVHDCYKDFRALAMEIADKAVIEIPVTRTGKGTQRALL